MKTMQSNRLYLNEDYDIMKEIFKKDMYLLKKSDKYFKIKKSQLFGVFWDTRF